ncbi:hypothetical protein L2D08_00280 [Domibacillus sp. PGB-M46]|uniref:hypothetical protein n=1 Tax=Domibacillus sp. PGB-M46 TaxID=2910255 RepID=UPI001F57ED1A|nr:hypothetical protein [Domibacillus sp. PGB-M46]MCI2252795.1 hypothetical protein [Domibacillus sp. PGB-M46]
MKAVKVTLCTLTLIVFGLFMLGYWMTPAPGASSGNGNPALLILIGLIPLFIVMTVLWWTLLRRCPFQAKTYCISILLLLTHLAAALFYRHHSLEAYRGVIRQALLNRYGTWDEQYVQDITTGLSIHINHQNFNVNTFLLFLSAVLLAAIVFRILDRTAGRES